MVTVMNVSPRAYNGSYPVTASSPGSVSYVSTASGALTTGSSATVGKVAGPGLFTVSGAGAVSATAYLAGTTAGVTCSGTPSASFAATGGIVTHC